ncbi:NAD(P)/FAD-dependent oxidoreductase [Lewinella sp. 4G2]|uniref:dihydrolipoyl dehydrogenase family protein n=1 Tax=Lewinella sp. 4G2 TaxID=1803372 RepID=UPI0007B4A094|nr:NAD(P)/FAD-dependent oxidoreductase [Lewinella sp. 4G2]OAV46040.1 hypothetical protein A3850_017380 [Lewinella sp. 4G2]
MPHHQFDLFVMGCGPAGQLVANSAVKAGLSVGITEATTYGGVCPNRGCDPKKVHYGVAKAMVSLQRLQGKGLNGIPKVNWANLQAWKTSFTEDIPEETEKGLLEKGVKCFKGQAVFTGPHEIAIGDDITIRAEKVIVATGGMPAPLDIPGKEHYLDSAGYLEMESLPERILFIGSGYIGASLSQISCILGAEVTVIASDDSPVGHFDHDLNDMWTKAAEEHGITFHFSSKATKIEKISSGLKVTCTPEEGDDFAVEVDAVIHCAGRVPNVKGIGLDLAGIDFSDKGISVDPQLRTSVSAHYAIGDCTDAAPSLTPVATYQGRLLSDNLFAGKNRKADYKPIPTMAMIEPPIAGVGMSAKEAEDDDRDLKIKFEDTTEWFTSRHLNCEVSGYKLITDPENDLILGAHLLGPNADEVINFFALAIAEKIPIKRLQHMILAYPTATSDVKKMLG